MINMPVYYCKVCKKEVIRKRGYAQYCSKCQDRNNHFNINPLAKGIDRRQLKRKPRIKNGI